MRNFYGVMYALLMILATILAMMELWNWAFLCMLASIGSAIQELQYQIKEKS